MVWYKNCSACLIIFEKICSVTDIYVLITDFLKFLIFVLLKIHNEINLALQHVAWIFWFVPGGPLEGVELCWFYIVTIAHVVSGNDLASRRLPWMCRLILESWICPEWLVVSQAGAGNCLILTAPLIGSGVTGCHNQVSSKKNNANIVFFHHRYLKELSRIGFNNVLQC